MHNSAADGIDFADHVRCCLEEEYVDPVHEIGREDGEYVVDPMTTSDLFFGHVDAFSDDQEVIDFVANELSDYFWVQRDYYRLDALTALHTDWRRFVQLIKHETRYLFFPPVDPEEDDETVVHPAGMLDMLGGEIIKAGVIRRLPAGTKVYRVRAGTPTGRRLSRGEVGPPPVAAVRQPNRMSPAGISMLYVATDEATAIAETLEAGTPNATGVLATFELRRPLRVVDLARQRRVPSLFTPGTTPRDRAGPQFLHAFAREVAQPIVRDERVHTEYVPTQVVTEYLRYRFRRNGRPVQGVQYRSSRSTSGANIALFIGHEAFAGPRADWLPSRIALRLLDQRAVSAS